MRPLKRGPGRPPGERFPLRLPFYDNDEGMALLQRMAHQDGCSAVALIRRLIRQEAAERGLTAPPAAAPPEEPIERRPGKCGGAPTIRGTRVAVHHVVAQAKRHNWDLERVHQEEMPHVDLRQIHAAVDYYHEHEDEIEEILRREQEAYEHLASRTRTGR